MKQYRILKKVHKNGVRYIVQKRLLGCLWWYNYLNDGTGFSKYEDAAKAIHNDAEEPKYEIFAELTFGNNNEN